ncbi:MAG TPA: hypothetical protein VMW50_10215 [Dehalococcoidia bacterium]|nr:hypothetical protein [Dehalococcoidia bacterium]
MSFLIDKVGIIKAGERHFCRVCRKLLREGEQYRVQEEPKPFRRETDYIYTHYPNCPVKEIKKGE